MLWFAGCVKPWVMMAMIHDASNIIETLD